MRLGTSVREVSNFLYTQNFVAVHTKARIRTIPIPFSTFHNPKQNRFNHFPIYGRVFKAVSSIYVFKPELFMHVSSPQAYYYSQPFQVPALKHTNNIR